MTPSVKQQTVKQQPVQQQTGWRASLDLRFEQADGRTRMRRGLGYGPLYVQKPFYPEADTCHVYLLHPPGGVVGGDRLNVTIDVDAGASALITTPAATKFYRSKGPQAVVEQRLRVNSEACLEWLPQENILYSASAVKSNTEVYLSPGSSYIGWEINCLGLPAARAFFTEGVFEQRIAIYRTTRARHSVDISVPTVSAAPLVLERNHWHARDPAMTAQWGLAGFNVVGTLYASPMGLEELKLLRSRLDASTGSGSGSSELVAALTLVNGVLIARVLSNSAETARLWLTAVWGKTRPLLLGRDPCRPRIWNT